MKTEFLSSTVIVTGVLFFANLILMRVFEQKNKKKEYLLNFALIALYLLLKIPENLSYIDNAYKIFPYYKFLYTTVFIFFASRILLVILIDLVSKKLITEIKIFNDILKGTIVFIAIIFLLKENGVSVNSIFTTSAILTAVIGLALQNTLSDIVAGLILSTENTVKVDDWIKYNDKIAKVVQFSWRYTKIITLENEHFIIPNKDLASNTIKVLSSSEFKHYTIIPFGVTYDNIPNKVIDVVMEATKNVKGVIDREVFFVKYGDFAIEFEIRLRIENAADYYRLRSNILTIVFYALDRAKMEIPIPRYDLFRRSYDEVSDDQKSREVRGFFSKIDFLQILTDEELNKVIRSVKHRRYAHGELILQQNQKNNKFFYIKDGLVDILVDSNKVAELKMNSFFGEMSLMTGEKTTATVKAQSDVEVYILSSEVFSDIIKNNQELVDKISKVIVDRKLQNEEKSKTKKQKKELAIEKSNLKKRIMQFFVMGQ